MQITETIREPASGTDGRPRILIVSDCPIGTTVTSRLTTDAVVCLVTDDEAVASRVPDDVGVVVGDVTSIDTLRRGVADGVDAAVVVTSTDGRTLLITQLLRTRLDVDHVAVVTRDPECRDAIDDVSTATVCSASVVASELRTALESTLRGTETV